MAAPSDPCIGAALRLLLVATLAAGAGPCGGCTHGSAAAPAPTAAAPQPALEGIRIQLVHDRQTGVTTYQVGLSPAGDAAALVPTLTAAEQEWTLARHSEATAIIVADETVPWKDVVAAVNACKRAGLSKVEFDFGDRRN